MLVTSGDMLHVVARDDMCIRTVCCIGDLAELAM